MKHIIAASLAMLLVPGCGGEAPGRAAAVGAVDDGTGSAQVIFKPEAVVMTEAEGMAMIRGVSTNESAFFLDGGNPKAQALKVGDAWMVKGVLARNIIAVAEQPTGEVLILTELADLTDFVSSAHLHVNQPVNFSRPQQKVHLLDVFGNIIAPPAHAQDPAEILRSQSERKGATTDFAGKMLKSLSGAVIDGWTIDSNPSFSGGKLMTNLKLTREFAGLRAVVKVDGYLDGFDFEGRIDIEQSRYKRIISGLEKLNGLVNVSWDVATETPGAHTGDHKIKLPASVQIPLSAMLDGLPLYLEISSAIIIKAGDVGRRGIHARRLPGDL
jgi:hypothetical protein